jgi:hypothetical protein
VLASSYSVFQWVEVVFSGFLRLKSGAWWELCSLVVTQ